MIHSFFTHLRQFLSGRDGGAFAATRTFRVLEYILLAACGSMFTLAFPGVGYSLIVWIGLIPLYLLTSERPVFSAFIRGYVWGFFWCGTAFFWLREIAFPLPILAGLVIGAFPAVWAMLTAWLKVNLAYPVEDRISGERGKMEKLPFSNPFRSLLFLFASASLWCLLEWVLSWYFTGLPWNYLAVTQWKNVILIQICEYTGMYGVSFVIVLFNLGLAMSLPVWRKAFREGKYRRSLPLMTACLVLALAIAAGWHLFTVQLRKIRNGAYDSHRIGCVQCGLSQRRFGGDESAGEALKVCVDLSRNLLDRQQKPELIIWPETAVPHAYQGGSEISRQYRREMTLLLIQYNVPFLVGSIDFEMTTRNPEGYDVYNSALLLKEPGMPADSYRKIHLVPFGEYVPLGELFPQIHDWIGMGRSLSAGTRYNPLEVLPGVRAGISICFESVFAEISRYHVLNGANLLLVISNDAWYPASNEPDQHFANAFFRAVETRLPLLRSGNADFTAVIDSTGRISDALVSKKLPNGRMQFVPETKVRKSGVLTVMIPKDHELTFYTRYGNLFVLICALLGGAGLIAAFVAWRDYRCAQADPDRCKELMRKENTENGR